MANIDIQKCPTSWLVKNIEINQDIQKHCKMDSREWKAASRDMAPAFKEMARRQADNAGEPDWKKWKWYI
jgi:hypothetical protein